MQQILFIKPLEKPAENKSFKEINLLKTNKQYLDELVGISAQLNCKDNVPASKVGDVIDAVFALNKVRPNKVPGGTLFGCRNCIVNVELHC